MVKMTTGGARVSRHSRLGVMLPGHYSMWRRACAGAALAALLAGGMALPTGQESLTPVAHAEVADAWPNVGHGYYLRDSVDPSVFHWFGANQDPSDPSRLLWCIEFGPLPIKDPNNLLAPQELVVQDQRGDTDPSIKLNPAQMYTVLEAYEGVDEDESRAALSILVHGNYDVSPDASRVMGEVFVAHPSAWAKAVEYANWARQNTPQNFEIPAATAPDAIRTGEIHGIQIFDGNGNRLSGIPVALTLNGPAVFDETGTNTWTGTTATEPLTVPWTATGNGKVSFTARYKNANRTMVKYGNDGSIQDMIGRGGHNADPVEETRPGEPFSAFYDFQPMATSSVADADSKVVDEQAGVIRDVIHVKADESYAQSPNWMYADGKPVPVVFRGTAYYTGGLPAAESASVPAGAKVVGTVMVTAEGPGDYTAEINTDLAPDMITWVWQVRKADQGEYADYVASDWSDHYGLAAETTSSRGKVEIASTVQSNVTRLGTFLVDNLYIDGFDEDHGDFEGGAGLGADVDELTQSLYFFPDGLEVIDANIPQATKVGEVSVPARNGYVDRVGSNKFKMLEGNPAGVYVFVTSFAGDDRTQPYVSSVSDVHEQVLVPPTPPEIKTTATDKTDGDKVLPASGDVTISDRVCQVAGKGLQLGKTYTLTATAMDKATGQAVLDEDGKPYVGTAEFTPASESDCGTVDVTIPASALWGKTVVMFEDVSYQGRTVALHTDIDDEDQSIPGPRKPEVGTTLTDSSDGDHEVAPGPVQLQDMICPKEGTVFEVGKAYPVQGVLMDKSTGKPLTDKDNQPIQADTVFTPTRGGECAKVTFKFDTTSLKGRELVAFETVFDPDVQGRVWAEHKDLDDKGQTVKVTSPPSLAKTGAAIGITSLSAAGLIGSGAMLVRRRRA